MDIFLDFVIKWRGGTKMTYRETPKEVEELMIPPDAAK